MTKRGRAEPIALPICTIGPRETEDCLQDQNNISPWIITIAREEFETPPKDRINTSSFGSILVRFRSPAAYRLQLRSTSCGIWFPQELSTGIAEAFSFMTSQAPTTPSLAIALDAASLIQIGQEHRDQRMVLEGQRMYCDALKFLQMGFARPAKERADALLGTILTLQVAEANLCMKGADWRNHTAGTAAFLRERAQANDRKAERFGWSHLVDRQFVIFQFWGALIARKRMDGLLLSDAPALYLIAQNVPGVLQECDKVCGGDFAENHALVVARRLKALEADLADWTTHWNRCIREAPFQLVSSSALPFPESGRTGEKQKVTFPLVFRFNNLSDCLDHNICTASMLAVKRAMLNLAVAAERNGHLLVLQEELPNLQSIPKATTACADTLCMALPYLCDAKHGKFGKVNTVSSLGIAMDWYRYLGDETGSKQAAQKLAWCKDAAAAVEKEGVRMLS